MNANDGLIIFISLIGIIFSIGFLFYYFSQGGSNTVCYNCGKDLKWGDHKNYSIEDENGAPQNICSTCYKRFERLNHKGRFW